MSASSSRPLGLRLSGSLLAPTAAMVVALASFTGCQDTTLVRPPASVGKSIGLPGKAEIEQALGRPDTTESLPNGREAWIYDFEKTKDHPVDFVTYLDLIGAGATRKMRQIIYTAPDTLVADRSFVFHAVRTPITLQMTRSLRPDMTTAEVAALLGPPTTVMEKEKQLVWQYDAYTKDFKLRTHLDLGFTEGKLTFYPLVPDSYLNEDIRVSDPRPSGVDFSKVTRGASPVSPSKSAAALPPTAP